MRVVIGLSPGSNSFLDAALAYASQGFLVFPCKEQSKEPATPRGFYNATTSPATIRRLFGSQRQYNVAIRCGQGPCFNFLFVMDLDGPEGEESWRALVTAHASPPATAEVKTANGRHLYFTANSPINCSTKRIAPGIDVRGDGGYVVAPPSVHPSGAVYRWLITGPVAPAPAWLIELAQKRPEPPIPISQRLLMQQAGRCRGSPNAYGAAALDQEIAALAAVPPGSRNHALNRTSFVLHQLVAGGELDAGEVERRLWDAATANGLISDPTDGPRRTRLTIASGARAGLQHPRSRRGQS